MDKVINTEKQKCTGCNKCILSCPVKHVNQVKVINQERKIEINQDLCIACGNCVQMCDHEARNYLDDTERFFADLKNGAKISVMLAPSFSVSEFENYKRVLGYLKKLGVNLLYDVSFGADISSWGYVKYLQSGMGDKKFMISQPCPPIVDYIEKYSPNLVEHLIPFQTPVMCAAIYMRKYIGITDKLALVSPCIAKKMEIQRESNQSLIEYSISYESLFNYVTSNNIDLLEYPEADYDSPPSGMGSMISKPGGLKDSIAYHMPELNIRHIEGTSKVYELLSYLNDGNDFSNIQLYDLLSCEKGCNVGPVSNKGDFGDEISSELEKEILSEIRLKNQNQIKINYEEYNKLFKFFDENLTYDDFTVSYEDSGYSMLYSKPNDEELDDCFEMLRKYDDESRKINCYSCGYKSCKDMAIAIHNGCNIPASCYQYGKKELEIQKKILQENGTYIRTVLEHLGEAVIVTDYDGYIEFINKRAENLLGFLLQECIYRKLEHFVIDMDFEKLDENGEKEAKCIKKDTTPCELKLQYNRISLQNKNVIVFIIEDITKEKELSALKNNFISMISHELRTPLTSIRGALGLVLSGVLGDLPDKSKDLLNIAGHNSIRLVNLINDILDLEKIKAGKMDFKFSEYSVQDLVDETIVLNNEYAKQYNVEYKVVNSLENANINVDKDKFIQVLTNLLSNAAKFSLPNEDVNVCVERNKHLITVSVQNKGVGIPESCKNQIFESFYQVDSSDSRKKSGSGLGLNICKSIVQKMGGTIGFESVVNDKTIFYFSFPEIYDKPDTKTVLVVEDNKSTAFGIKSMLKKLDFDADIALNAKEARELLKMKNYALMTIDVLLPDENGLVLLDEIRANNETKNLPVIVISASPVDKDQICKRHKIVDLLEKSFDIESLRGKIKEVIDKKKCSKVSILHVENDKDLLNVIKSNLDNFADITRATTIKEARKTINEALFDIIILDYSLPDGTSDELVNDIYKSINCNSTLVVFSEYEINDFLKSQVDATILKSKVSNEQFCKCIERFVNKTVKFGAC